MRSLLRAEWDKVVKNRVLMGFLVLLIPVGQGAFVTLTIIAALISKEAALPMALTSSQQWTTDLLGPWAMITFFPINIIGRLLPLAFMAVVFAGEYEWDTWKNIIPRSDRVRLILAKYIVLIAMVAVSIMATGIISAAGFAINHSIMGMPYGPVVTWDTINEFLVVYGQQFLLGLLSLLILAGFAALAAMLTRSILGGLLVGMGFSVVEPMSLALLSFLQSIFRQPGIIKLYLAMPSFHIDNARSWFLEKMPLTANYLPDGVDISLALSLVLLTVWAFGLTGLAALLFQRQDIT